MKRFEIYRNTTEESIKEIEEHYLKSNDNFDMSELTKWLLETDANPYGYLPEAFASMTFDAKGMLSVLRVIAHALFDDGEITFAKIDGQPRIVFAHKDARDFVRQAVSEVEYEVGLRRGDSPDVVVLDDINHNDFGKIYDEYHREAIRGYFFDDAEDAETVEEIQKIAEIYKKYSCWSDSWIDEAVKLFAE